MNSHIVVKLRKLLPLTVDIDVEMETDDHITISLRDDVFDVYILFTYFYNTDVKEIIYKVYMQYYMKRFFDEWEEVKWL